MTSAPMFEPGSHGTPIRDRVPDLGEPGEPGAVAGVRWRRPSIDDAVAVREVANLAGAVEHPEHRVPLQEVVDDLEATWDRLDADWFVAEVDDRVVAFCRATMSPGQETVRRVVLDGAVAPAFRRRGIGTALLGWQQRRAAQRLRELDDPLTAEMLVWASDGSPVVPLATSAGFAVERWFIDLHRDLAQPIEPMDDGGLAIVPLESGLHEAARVARNDAFRDHWGSQPTVEERWRRFVERDVMRSDLSSLAVEGEGDARRVVGFVLAEHDPEDDEAAGYSAVYVSYVGIVRDRRGRGIAPRLLTRTLEAARDAGLERAVLDVDSESPTGAVGLYDRLGFTAAKRSVVLRRAW